MEDISSVGVLLEVMAQKHLYKVFKIVVTLFLWMWQKDWAVRNFMTTLLNLALIEKLV